MLIVWTRPGSSCQPVSLQCEAWLSVTNIDVGISIGHTNIAGLIYEWHTGLPDVFIQGSPHMAHKPAVWSGQISMLPSTVMIQSTIRDSSISRLHTSTLITCLGQGHLSHKCLAVHNHMYSVGIEESHLYWLILYGMGEWGPVWRLYGWMGTSVNVVWVNGDQCEGCMGEWWPVWMVYGWMGISMNVVWVNGDQCECCMGEWGPVWRLCGWVWVNGDQWECCMGEWGQVGMLCGWMVTSVNVLLMSADQCECSMSEWGPVWMFYGECSPVWMLYGWMGTSVNVLWVNGDQCECSMAEWGPVWMFDGWMGTSVNVGFRGIWVWPGLWLDKISQIHMWNRLI